MSRSSPGIYEELCREISLLPTGTCVLAVICLSHSPLAVKHILIDCTCFTAAHQRYLGVGTLKELFDNAESRNVVAFIKDASFYHCI